MRRREGPFAGPVARPGASPATRPLAAELRQGRDAPASEAAARELLEPSGAGNNSTSQAPPRTIARRSHLPPEQI